MAPILAINRFSKGLVTQRNAFDTPITFAGANAVPHYDTLIDGFNMEVSPWQTLRRRPGYGATGLPALAANESALNFGLFVDLQGNRRTVVDSNLRFATYGIGVQTIYSKMSGAGMALWATLGNHIYIADGVNNFKWDGTNTQQWGIVAPLAAPNVNFTALQYSTFITSDSYDNADTFQGNLTIQVGQNGTPQTASFGAGTTLDQIVSVLNGGAGQPTIIAINSAFSSDYVPGQTSGGSTSGGQAPSGGGTTTPSYYNSITYNTTSNLPSSVKVGDNITVTGNSDSNVNISGSISEVGTNYFKIGYYSTTYESGTGGSGSISAPPTDYGVTATKQAAGSLFQIVVASKTIGQDGILMLSSSVVDTKTATKSFQFVVGNGVAALAPSYGYSWRYAYSNSTTEHLSTASPATTPFASQAIAGQATISGVGSPDSQVDTVEIYRTNDGGATWYYSGAVPNTPMWSYTDSVQDEDLNTDIIAPIDNANDPPLAGATDPVFHIDRIWYHVGNTLYYTGGPDTVNGVGAEASPPANYIPSYPGKIIKKISMPQGLLVFLETDVHLVTGLDSTSFKSQLIAKNMGISNPLAVVADGQDFYVFTTSNQLWWVPGDRDQIEIGFDVQGITQLNPLYTSVVVHRNNGLDQGVYVTDSSQSIFYRYDLKSKSWSTRSQPMMGVALHKSFAQYPGQVRLFMMPGGVGQTMYVRNLSQFNDNGVPYPLFAEFGIFTLAPTGSDPVVLNSVSTTLLNYGSVPTVTIIPDELFGAGTVLTNPVDDPPNYAPANTLLKKRWYTSSTDTPINRKMNYLRLRFTWPSEGIPNEMFNMFLLSEK